MSKRSDRKESPLCRPRFRTSKMLCRNGWLVRSDKLRSLNEPLICRETQTRLRRGSAFWSIASGQPSSRNAWARRWPSIVTSKQASSRSDSRPTTRTCVRSCRSSWPRNRLIHLSSWLSLRMSESMKSWKRLMRLRRRGCASWESLMRIDAVLFSNRQRTMSPLPKRSRLRCPSLEAHKTRWRHARDSMPTYRASRLSCMPRCKVCLSVRKTCSWSMIR